jgi:hypothetical protein
MTRSAFTTVIKNGKWSGWWLLILGMVITATAYKAGLSGGYLFDDYPNIVDNQGVQPPNASLPALIRAALSSPSSEFKRPLASLTFAINFLATGLNPYWMKLTNLIIHLLNGLLAYLLARSLILGATAWTGSHQDESNGTNRNKVEEPCGCAPPHIAATGDNLRTSLPSGGFSRLRSPTLTENTGVVGALIAICWMLLPINLTGVLYVVQRMESMANIFVFLGLLVYTTGRCRMLHLGSAPAPLKLNLSDGRRHSSGLALCMIGIIAFTALGVLAKETAVMLPLYAILIEWLVFRFVAPGGKRDWRIFLLFVVVLMLPMLLGLAWLLPSIFKTATWATRDFTR